MHFSVQSLSPKYQKVVNRFFSLAAQHNWPAIRSTAISLPALLAYLQFQETAVLAGRLKASSVLSYLSALTDYHFKNHVDWSPIRNHLRVKLLLQRIEAVPVTIPKTQSHAVSITELTHFCRSVDLTQYNQVLAAALATTLFFSLGRVSELLHADSHPPMLMTSLQLIDGNYRIFVEKPKVRKSHDQFLYPLRAQAIVNAQLWLRTYLALADPNRSHLWVLADGSRPTARWFHNVFSQLARTPRKTEQSSFRAGGTTHLVSLGYSLERIRVLGRWDSDAFICYIRCLGTALISTFSLL